MRRKQAASARIAAAYAVAVRPRSDRSVARISAPLAEIILLLRCPLSSFWRFHYERRKVFLHRRYMIDFMVVMMILFVKILGLYWLDEK